MSSKSDGTNGKKPSAAKDRVFKAKSTKPQKKHEAIVAAHKATDGKQMKVPRGTARAKLRAGMQAGIA